MKNYYVEFYTTDGKKVGITISAYTSVDATLYAKNMPNYSMMANYPVER